MEYQQKKVRRDPNGRILEKGEQYEKKTKRYRFDYTGIDGSVHRIRATSLKKLREKKKRIERDLLDGLNTAEGNKITMNDMFDMWINNKVKLKPQTRENYKSMYNNNVRESFLGKMRITDIKPLHIAKFYKKCGLAEGSIRIIKTCLLQPLKCAVDNDLIRKNPVSGVEYDAEKTERTGLTQEQQTALLDFVKDHHLYGYCYGWILFAIETGLRAGELEGLIWDDLSEDGNAISVQRQIQYRNIEGVTRQRIESTKTAAGVRNIPLTERAKEALRAQKEIDMEKGKRSTEAIDGVTGFVFVNRNGKPYLTSSFNFVLVNIVKAHNELEKVIAELEHRPPLLLPHISMHILRHTACSNMAAKNMNPKVLQKIMGHKTLDVTMNIYTHTEDETVRQECERLGLVKKA